MSAESRGRFQADLNAQFSPYGHTSFCVCGYQVQKSTKDRLKKDSVSLPLGERCVYKAGQGSSWICGCHAGIAALCQQEVDGKLPKATCSFPASAFTQGAAGTLRLCSISDVEGVNALAPKKPLEFGKGNITVVYGNNGSGKSGYVRLLKHICGARDIGALHRNVYKPGSAAQKACISFEQDGAPKSHTWSGQGICDDLNSVDIFDTSFGKIFVSSEDEVSYEPPVLLFFSSLILVCERVATALDAEANSHQSRKPNIPAEKKATPEGIWYESLCEAITTTNNILLFHVGVWTYSPVEIGNMKPEDALPLADVFDYVALGHGHKPYIIATPEGRPYAFNPGSPECVNFGEEKYDKGYYLVTVDDGVYSHEFRPTNPRPMLVTTIDLDGADDAEAAVSRFREQVAAKCATIEDDRQPLLEMKLTGRVGFHPFELGRERLRLALEEICNPLHVEIKNHLSLVTAGGGAETEKKSLAEIEWEVLRELVSAKSEYKGREDELVRLSLAIRDQVLKGEVDGEELLGLLMREPA